MMPDASTRPAPIHTTRPMASILLAIAILSFLIGFGAARIELPSVERSTGAATPTFDVGGFFAGERAPLSATPTFDVGGFFAGERAPLFSPPAR
jgi:hypothetical protein